MSLDSPSSPSLDFESLTWTPLLMGSDGYVASGFLASISFSVYDTMVVSEVLEKLLERLAPDVRHHLPLGPD